MPCVSNRLIQKRKACRLLNEPTFRQPRQVVAWLGSAVSVEGQDAFAIIERMNSDINYTRPGSQWRLAFPDKGEPIPPPEMKSVHRFLNLSCWSRRWVVQELLLARNVVLMSNGAIIRFSKLIKLLGILQEMGGPQVDTLRFKKTIPFSCTCTEHLILYITLAIGPSVTRLTRLTRLAGDTIF